MTGKNKKGFTLVELMVVIIIIGILAAVALPRFANAINKAKCSEATNILGQIHTSEEIYNAETSDYYGFDTSTAISDVEDELGVRISSDLFAYSVDTTDTTGYLADASLKDKIGKAAEGEGITVNANSSRSFNGDADKIKLYIKNWN